MTTVLNVTVASDRVSRSYCVYQIHYVYDVRNFRLLSGRGGKTSQRRARQHHVSLLVARIHPSAGSPLLVHGLSLNQLAHQRRGWGPVRTPEM